MVNSTLAEQVCLNATIEQGKLNDIQLIFNYLQIKTVENTLIWGDFSAYFITLVRSLLKRLQYFKNKQVAMFQYIIIFERVFDLESI